MNEKNHVTLEGVVKKKGVRRGFFGDVTSLFLHVPTSRGSMHIQVFARLSGEEAEIREGVTVRVEGELDYEKRRNGGFEVFVAARTVEVLTETLREAEDDAIFDF